MSAEDFRRKMAHIAQTHMLDAKTKQAAMRDLVCDLLSSIGYEREADFFRVSGHGGI